MEWRRTDDGGFEVGEGGTKQPLIAFSHAVRRGLALAQEGADVSNLKWCVYLE